MDATELQRERDFVEKANKLVSQGEFQKALTAYNHALAIDPSDADVLFDKAETLAKLGNVLEAQKLYDAAIAMYTSGI